MFAHRNRRINNRGGIARPEDIVDIKYIEKYKKYRLAN